MKSLKDILYQIKMKMNLEDKNMKVELTQKEIDIIYFTIKQYVKNNCDVDYLKELSNEQNDDWKNELELIKKFSKL